MKTLFVLVLGIVIGAAGLYFYQQPSSASAPRTVNGPAIADSSRDAANAAVAKSRAAAADFSDALAAKMQAWHLTREDIRADLARTGEVARENTAHLREKAADARIVAVIKAKLVLDRDLSATAVTVASTDGDVTLSGSVASDELVGRAVALAMDTDGVHHVTAKLAVKTAP